MKTIYLVLASLLLSINVFSQNKSRLHKKHHPIHKTTVSKLQADTPRVTDLHNSGSSNGTMASNNNPGKVTTSDKGKPAGKNGLVRKGQKK